MTVRLSDVFTRVCSSSLAGQSFDVLSADSSCRATLSFGIMAFKTIIVDETIVVRHFVLLV